MTAKTKPSPKSSTLSDWSGVIQRIGQERREHAAGIKALIDKIEASGGPQTPEDWAFYYLNKQVPPSEQDAFDNAGTSFLTECFRRAMSNGLKS